MSRGGLKTRGRRRRRRRRGFICERRVMIKELLLLPPPPPLDALYPKTRKEREGRRRRLDEFQ